MRERTWRVWGADPDRPIGNYGTQRDVEVRALTLEVRKGALVFRGEGSVVVEAFAHGTWNRVTRVDRPAAEGEAGA